MKFAAQLFAASATALILHEAGSKGATPCNRHDNEARQPAQATRSRTGSCPGGRVLRLLSNAAAVSMNDHFAQLLAPQEAPQAAPHWSAPHFAAPHPAPQDAPHVAAPQVDAPHV
eukprot:CAMPEP_0204459574 /NCGR_PEP_ID=MMETSP0471-20130131/4235_1 /ASSEMBLY_ACC=CAM_ASM_000602 /TAXON_ID=2969 /ORGANISM="Oxyrrhis marina" /LENGTH=114 /DNA_ID=CAMNT_0051460353 /DNA_START=211 /DNA_END=552 /DNA_ORIENTATION=+